MSSSAVKVTIGYVQDATFDQIDDVIRKTLAALLGSDPSAPLRNMLPQGEGRTVVIKPNMVRHFNPRFDLDAVVTSPLVVRAVASIARRAIGPEGRIIVADSPQNDCDFDALLNSDGWRALRDDSWLDIQFVDMRPERVVMADGVITARTALAGDPLGEVLVDLGAASAFTGSGIPAVRLRGSDYDPAVTRSSHADGRHRYSVCSSFLSADLLIVVPKVKTHKKVGLSLGMKNLVGIVGEKNCLPHHTEGFPDSGGDEYPRRSVRSVWRQRAVERARPILARGRYVPVFRLARRMESALLPDIPVRSGNWWGNDTAWRMVVDLVAILGGTRARSQRPTLFVYDALVVGEGEGPLAPSPLPWNMIAAAENPVAGDIVVTRELGLDPRRFRLLREAEAREPWSGDDKGGTAVWVTDRSPGVTPKLHPGWVGQPDGEAIAHG